jgi:ribosome-associated protein
MTTTPKSESAAKKDVTKLQRAIVDGLEDIKAQDIQVFDTEHLSPLFERVIVASGTSNRQTKAIAASVRDKVREAGFPKPRMEGEENGEWIIVDCGAAVAHIMQPTIRQYYRLEELWGDTPVRMKIGAPKPAAPAAAKVPVKTAARRAAKAEAEAATTSDTPVAKKPAAKKTTARKTSSSATPAKPAAKTAAKTAAKAPAKTAVKTPIKTVVVKPRAEKVPAKKAGAKTAAAKTAARKTAAPRKAS